MKPDFKIKIELDMNCPEQAVLAIRLLETMKAEGWKTVHGEDRVNRVEPAEAQRKNEGG